MVDISSEVGGLFTAAQSFGLQTIGVVAWFFIVIILGMVAGVVTWIVVTRKKYNIKIIIFERINGVYQPTRKDTAIEQRWGDDGTTVFYLRKHKKLLPRGNLQMGPRMYWYKIRDDGEWENIDSRGFFESETEQQKYLLHRDMRLSRTAMQKQHRDRFEKKQSWLAQNWTVVAGIAFIAMMGIMVFLLFDKWIELASTVNGAVEAAGKVLESTDQVIARLDVLQNGGSGFVQTSG